MKFSAVWNLFAWSLSLCFLGLDRPRLKMICPRGLRTSMRGPRNLEYTRHVLRFRGRAPSRPQTTIIKSFLVAGGLACAGDLPLGNHPDGGSPGSESPGDDPTMGMDASHFVDARMRPDGHSDEPPNRPIGFEPYAGPEFRIGDSSTSRQPEPQDVVVAFNGENYLVTWLSRRDDRDGSDETHSLWGIRLNRSGRSFDRQPFLIAPRVSSDDPIRVAGSPFRFVVLWRRGADVNYTVVQAYGPSGLPYYAGVSQTVLQGSSEERLAYDIASNGNNFLLVTGSLDRGSLSQGLYLNKNGRRGFSFQIDDTHTTYAPSVTQNGTDYLLTWIRTGVPTGSIYVASVNGDHDGIRPLQPTLDPQFVYRSRNPFPEAIKPASACSEGNCGVAWSEHGSVQILRVSPQGQPLEEEPHVVFENYYGSFTLSPLSGQVLVATHTDYEPGVGVLPFRRVDRILRIRLSDGVALDQRPLWFSLADADPNARYLSAITAGAEDFLLVWNNDFESQFLPLAGRTPTAAAVSIRTSFPASQYNIQAVAMRGGFLVAWQEKNQTMTRLLASRFRLDATPIDSRPFLLHEHEERSDPQPSERPRDEWNQWNVASNGENFLVVWNEDRSFFSSAITMEGQPDPEPHVLFESEEDTWQPQLAGAGGNYLLSWFSNSGIRAAAIDSSGGLKSMRTLPSSNSRLLPATVRVIADGDDFVYAWSDRHCEHAYCDEAADAMSTYFLNIARVSIDSGDRIVVSPPSSFGNGDYERFEISAFDDHLLVLRETSPGHYVSIIDSEQMEERSVRGIEIDQENMVMASDARTTFLSWEVAEYEEPGVFGVRLKPDSFDAMRVPQIFELPVRQGRQRTLTRLNDGLFLMTYRRFERTLGEDFAFGQFIRFSDAPPLHDIE